MDTLGEIGALITRHATSGLANPKVRGVRRTILEGISIASVAEPTAPAAVMTEPSLALIGRGVKRTVLNGTTYDYRAGEYLVASIDLPVTGQVLEAAPNDPFVVFSMALKPTLIASLLLETPVMLETPVGGRRPSFSGLGISTAPTELLDAIVRMLRLLDSPNDVRILGPAYEREITWRLITGDQGPIVRQIGLTDGSLTHIARVIREIREHYAEPLRVGELAALASMSLSSFHRHFRSATSMTPIQFQKQIRLQEARALLFAGARDIAEVGYLVGYESPSQFSREYSRAFGEPPGHDAARLASQSAGGDYW